jgi:hypothetical protein
LTPNGLHYKLIGMTEAEELLTDVHTLRRRVRRDRRAAAFPLLLFGALILLAPLCYVPLEPFPGGQGGFVIIDEGPFPLFFGIGPFVEVKYPGLIGWYWFLSIVLGFTATAWWYRRRAVRVGVETDTRAYLVAAGAAFTGFVIGVPLLRFLVPARNTLYSTPSTNLPILFGSAALAAAILFWCTRKTRSDLERAVGLFFGLLLATVAFAALGVYLIYGFAALLIIAAGLLTLAWLERSVLLAVTGLVFTAASVIANVLEVGEKLFPEDWYSGSTMQVVVLRNLLLPGVVLIVGGIVAAVSGRTSR